MNHCARSTPNATAQQRPEAEARHERTLFAVACSRLFGKVPASCAPSSSVPRTPIGSPHLIRQDEERRGERDPERLGRLEIEDQLELQGLLDG